LLLDTLALLAHYRQEVGWEQVQALFEAEEADLMAAKISLTEFGRRLRDLGATEAEMEETLANFQLLLIEVVPIDTVVAKAAFLIGCRTPHRLPLADALIAAVAQTRAARLVHRDEHMRLIPSTLIVQLDLAVNAA
jgi:predicted nucleic acid-binding protein